MAEKPFDRTITRRQFVRGAAGIAVGVGAAGFLQACAQAAATPAPAAPTSGATAGPATAPPPSAQTAAKTLVYARGGDIQFLDSAYLFDGESTRTSCLMQEPLVRFKVGSDGELEPALAEKWAISDDGLTYTFNLRKGVKFHDGTPFNAEAVKINFDRQLAANAQPRMQWAAPIFGRVARVETPDDSTVQLVLSEPQGSLLIQMAHPATFIMSPAALQQFGDDYTAHPVGTGPFIYDAWDRDAQYVVKANPDYWGGKPKVDRVILKVTKEGSVRVDQLLTGEADVITDIAPLDVARIESNPDTAIVTSPPINFAVMGFLMFRPPFDDIRVRKAINLAINRQALVEFLYKDKGIVLDAPLPKASWAYNSDLQGYPYDPEQAKTLLAEAGWDTGLSFEALTFNQARPYCPLGMGKVAEVVQADLKKVGVDMRLRTMPGVGETEDAAARGEGDAFFTGYFFSGDPGPIFNLIWTSSAAAPAGGNLPRYSNPEVDNLIAQALPESDQAKRKDIYWKIQELILADAPMVFINSYATLRGVRKSVSNFVIQPDQNDYLWLVDKA